MKIAVYGATGMIGREIVAESLGRGHEVTAISRNATEVAGAKAHGADLADSTTFTEIVDGHDVVVLATGPSRSGGSHEEWLTAMKSAYANAAGTRLMVVGGAGALKVNGARLVDSPDFSAAYKNEALTMAAAYEALQDAPAALDWTMLAPAPLIKPGERTGVYTTATDSPAGDSISTQDYAVAMLDEIESPTYRRARFTAAN